MMTNELDSLLEWFDLKDELRTGWCFGILARLNRCEQIRLGRQDAKTEHRDGHLSDGD